MWIPKPGSQEKRPLGIPAVRDRVVQTALRQTLEPIFEHIFSEHSYGFRPNRGCKDAVRRVDALLKTDKAVLARLTSPIVQEATLHDFYSSLEKLRSVQEAIEQRLHQRLAAGGTCRSAGTVREAG